MVGWRGGGTEGCCCNAQCGEVIHRADRALMALPGEHTPLMATDRCKNTERRQWRMLDTSHQRGGADSEPGGQVGALRSAAAAVTSQGCSGH